MTNPTHPLLAMIRNAAHEPQSRASDSALLDRFLQQGDEAAFALLMRRHGAMVMGVCRRVLGHAEDAEDACQATFLVLLRKAASVKPRDRVGAWLHGVATRTALETRALRAKRRAKEAQAPPRCDHTTEQRRHRELRELLDEQLCRLPEKYRLPILLCDLQGCAQSEAARQLGCPEGTVASRLFRGRRMLARRLSGKGFAVTASMLSGLLAREARAESSLGSLVPSAMDPIRSSDPVSSEVSTIVEGVLRNMCISYTKMTLLVVSVLLVSAGLLGLIGYEPSVIGAVEPTPVTPAKKPKSAENLFHEMENRLLEAKTLKVRVELASESGEDHKKLSSGTGELLTQQPNLFRLELGSQAPNGGPVKNVIISDGKQIVMSLETKVSDDATERNSITKKMTVSREPFLKALSRPGLSGFGVLLEAIEKSTEAPAKGGEKKLYRITKLHRLKDEDLGEKTVPVLEYSCKHPDGGTFEVKLWLDPKTGLPLKRVTKKQREAEGKKKYLQVVTETYSDWSFGKPIDPEKFRVTPR